MLDSIKTDFLPNHNFSGNLKELDKKVKSMMVLGDNILPIGTQGRHFKVIVCIECDKEGNHTKIRNHIKANHLKETTLQCHSCEKILRTRKGLIMHKCNLA